MHEFEVLLIIITYNNFFRILNSVLQFKVIELIYLARTLTLCVLYVDRIQIETVLDTNPTRRSVRLWNMDIKRKQCTETHDIRKENMEKNLWTNQRTKWPMENQNQWRTGWIDSTKNHNKIYQISKTKMVRPYRKDAKGTRSHKNL